MLEPIQMGTNMAAGRQEGHLSLSFPTFPVFLEKLKTLK